MPKIIVIGGGVAGLGATLELAERGYHVTLIEKSTLGSGSSGRNPGRMGHGFHYIDVDTALMYLRESIAVQKKYSGHLIGQTLPFSHPFRHGRYFITKNSDNSVEQILTTYQKIQEEYARLVKEDPRNEVFGSPENFFKILKPEEYQTIVNTDIVSMGVETNEHLFDWNSFIHNLRSIILSKRNIRLYEDTELLHLERSTSNKARFILRTKQERNKIITTKIFYADFIINSTWYEIEKINAQIGLTMIPYTRSNRLKALLLVKLPPTLINAHSMFFCMGQHCMFSNLGNGYGMMTYANLTNMEVSTDLELSKFAQRLINNGATDEEKHSIAQNMLRGIEHYIPAIRESTVIDVKFGIVQTTGALSLEALTDPTHSFHKRDYDGIREEQIGLISNPCMKLFYFIRNGNVVADLVAAELKATTRIKKCMSAINVQMKSLGIPLSKSIASTINTNTEKYFTSAEINAISLEELTTDLVHSIIRKNRLIKEITSSTSPCFLMKIMASPTGKCLIGCLLLSGMYYLSTQKCSYFSTKINKVINSANTLLTSLGFFSTKLETNERHNTIDFSLKKARISKLYSVF